MGTNAIFDLSGEVAVVIGATGALGGALAQGLAEAGARVAVLGRNTERGNACIKTIQERGGHSAFFEADAIQKESLRSAHKALEKTLGAPTVLVNAAGGNDPKVTDSAFMGPWLADTIRQCDGLAQMMSYWAFSDVFEEQGVVKTPFYGGFGLLAERAIPKAAFNDFALLHRLGDARLEASSNSVLVTRGADGVLAIAVWNLLLPEETGAPMTVTLRFRCAENAGSAHVTILDAEHGSPLPAYARMGSPRFLTQAQIRTLREAAAMPATQTLPLSDGALTLTLPPHALALVELAK